MQTLMELLVAEYEKEGRKTTVAGAKAVRDFVTFAQEYLAANRPRIVDHRTADNLGVTLSNAVEVLLSPPTPATVPGADRRNVDVVGVSTVGNFEGGMDRVPGQRI